LCRQLAATDSSAVFLLNLGNAHMRFFTDPDLRDEFVSLDVSELRAVEISNCFAPAGWTEELGAVDLVEEVYSLL